MIYFGVVAKKIVRLDRFPVRLVWLSIYAATGWDLLQKKWKLNFLDKRIGEYGNKTGWVIWG